MSKCIWHLCEEKATIHKGKFCGSKCKNKYYVDKRRKTLKAQAIEYKGGKCMRCGYDRCAGALTFHHRDPTEKEFGIASSGHSRSWDRVRIELDKCDLLCQNCHHEEHWLRGEESNLHL